MTFALSDGEVAFWVTLGAALPIIAGYLHAWWTGKW